MRRALLALAAAAAACADGPAAPFPVGILGPSSPRVAAEARRLGFDVADALPAGAASASAASPAARGGEMAADWAVLRLAAARAAAEGSRGFFVRLPAPPAGGDLLDLPEEWQAPARALRELKAMRSVLERGAAADVPFTAPAGVRARVAPEGQDVRRARQRLLRRGRARRPGPRGLSRPLRGPRGRAGGAGALRGAVLPPRRPGSVARGPPAMSVAARILKSSLFRNVELFALLGLSFWITPVIVRALGERQYGLWTLVGAFMGYYNLMNYGVYAAASRYVAKSLGVGDREEVNRAANTGFFLLCALGAATLAATLAGVAACGWFMSDPAEIALLRRVLLVLGVATAAGFPLNLFGGILTADVRHDIIALISIVKAVVSNVAIWLLLSEGHGLLAVAVVTAAANLAQNAAYYAVCRARLPYIRVVPFRRDAAQVRAMFDYGWKILAGQVGDILRFQLDSVLIAGFLNAALLTPFSIGVRLVDGFQSLVGASVGMMAPVFSQYEGRGDLEGMREALLKVTRFTALLTTFVGLSLIFYGEAFILRWMGPGFQSGYTVTVILAAAFTVYLPMSPGVQLLYGLSKHGSYAALNIAGGALNLLLSMVFLRVFGMYGAALGTAAEILLLRLTVQPFYICRAVGLPVRVYLFDAILGTVLEAAAPLCLYFWAIRGFIRPDFFVLSVCVALQAALFAPAAYFLILGEDERRYVAELVFRRKVRA
ncbi:MAG: oligosaccharide flippase family protein [Elusimicrobiota bacterium]|nr:MAG: oligosaccharide flippase family protein [Elusimicrobiota bacterium]